MAACMLLKPVTIMIPEVPFEEIPPWARAMIESDRMELMMDPSNYVVTNQGQEVAEDRLQECLALYHNAALNTFYDFYIDLCAVAPGVPVVLIVQTINYDYFKAFAI